MFIEIDVTASSKSAELTDREDFYTDDTTLAVFSRYWNSTLFGAKSKKSPLLPGHHGAFYCC
jgi:hypothetical protein